MTPIALQNGSFQDIGLPEEEVSPLPWTGRQNPQSQFLTGVDAAFADPPTLTYQAGRSESLQPRHRQGSVG